jgi:DNA-binding transcriptional ArsR family regulator
MPNMAYARSEDRVDGILSALADFNRRAVLMALRERPYAVGELAERVGISQPGTSKHLRVLLNAGLVGVRAEAQRRIYRLDVGPLAEIDAWLEPYRQLWEERLDALEEHLDRKATNDEQED